MVLHLVKFSFINLAKKLLANYFFLAFNFIYIISQVMKISSFYVCNNNILTLSLNSNINLSRNLIYLESTYEKLQF